MSSSTPDALWSAPSLRLLRPTGISCANVSRGKLLDRCSLSVPVGTRLLLVSEPEASASALLHVLAGLSRPRRGRIEIAGMRDPSRDGWGRRVAYLGPEPGIRGWMTPRETLTLAAELLGLARRDAGRRMERVLSWTRIPPADVDRPLARGGPQLEQRTGLAAALLGDPEVLLLDEPLRALDTGERNHLLRLPDPRRTMVLVSRYPASEAGLVGHLALMRGGRVAMVARIDDLEASGLPLSMRGILGLADLRQAVGASDARHRSAVATR